MPYAATLRDTKRRLSTALQATGRRRALMRVRYGAMIIIISFRVIS